MSVSPSPRPRVVVTIVTYRSRPASMRAGELALANQTVGVEVLTHHNSEAANLGFAGAHNRLLARAFAGGAALVVVHNPDLALRPDAIAQLVSEAERRPRALLGPLLERAETAEVIPSGRVDSLGIRWTRDGRHLDAGQGQPLPVRPGGPRRVAGLSGACLAVPRASYERIMAASGEFFDEDFIAYREDAELAIRANLLGVESWLVPAARGLHVRGQRGTLRGGDSFVDLLGVRNRFLIAAKWGRLRPGFLPAILCRDAVVILAVLLVERGSLPGLRQAWLLRHRMRDKGRRARAWSRAHPVFET